MRDRRLEGRRQGLRPAGRRLCGKIPGAGGHGHVTAGRRGICNRRGSAGTLHRRYAQSGVSGRTEKPCLCRRVPADSGNAVRSRIKDPGIFFITANQRFEFIFQVFLPQKSGLSAFIVKFSDFYGMAVKKNHFYIDRHDFPERSHSVFFRHWRNFLSTMFGQYFSGFWSRSPETARDSISAVFVPRR